MEIRTLPALLLTKPPSGNGTKVNDPKPIVQRRQNQYDTGDWRSLISDYKNNVLNAQTVHEDDTQPQGGNKDEARIRKATDLLSQFQCSKVHKHLQSNGLGDHEKESVVEQMKQNHPAQKKPISSLSEEELQATRKGISGDVLRENVRGPKHYVAPGL